MSKFLDEQGLSYVWSKIKTQVTAQNNLSNNYSTSALENEQLLLQRGDSFELAFSKLEKAILDNEEITAASLNNLNDRISERNLQDYIDNQDGSIELFKVDCAGSVLLPTWSKLTSLPAYNITNSDITTWNRGFNSDHFIISSSINLKNDANQTIEYIVTSADPQGAVSHGSPTAQIPTLEFLDYRLSSYINAGSYDSTNKKILLKHDNTTISSIDATAFIKDGMVNSVTVSTPTSGTHAGIKCVIITFNTDAGKDNIEIPVSELIDPSAYVKHANTSLSTHTFDWDQTAGDVTVEDKTVHVGSDILTVANGQTITLSVTAPNTHPMYVLNSVQTEILASGENGTVTYTNHTGSSQQIYAAIDNNDRTTTYNTEILTTGYDDEVEYLEDMVGVEVFEFDDSNITWDTTLIGYDTVKNATYDQGELFQSILKTVKKGKSVLLKYNDLHFNLIQADAYILAFSLSILGFSNFENRTISFLSTGEVILETSQISSEYLKSSIDKANSAVQNVTVTQSPSTGTSIQVNNNPAYTLVSDTEPSGSANGYTAPTWGAMNTALGNKVDTTTVEENELVTSAALNDLNSRINDLNTEKQDVLVSGTDIKTINNQSILGSGNIDITSDLGDSLVSMFSKLDEITPVRTIEFDVAATTGQIIYSRANVTEDALLNNVTDTLIYSIEVSGNSNSNIYDQYKVYAHFQPCAQRSPMTFVEHICKNPASSASLYGLRLLTYYYPKAVNNGYPWICYLTASSTNSRHVKIRVYQDSSNVDWKNPAIPVAVTAGLYNTTYQTKGSEMTITSTGWITNGITQTSSTTATISTSLPKNFVGSIYQAGEALTGGNLVYRALNDGKIYRVGTLTTSIDNATVNLTLDPMFGVSRIVNSRASGANIVASDLDYKRAINPSTPNNGSSFQIETGWTKGDTMYYKCTQSGSLLIPTGHITSTLSPGYAYFPIGVINSASSLDFDCIGHEFITLNASGKVTHVNGLEIAGGSGSGGGSTVVVSQNTDPNEHAPLGTSIVVDGNSKSIITNTKPSGTQALLEAPSWQALEDSKVTIYSGSSTPSNSSGNNGDLYLQTS